MYEERDTGAEDQRPRGVIACLTHGFEVVAHRPQLALLPILLDLFLWLGPRLSLARLLLPSLEFWAEAPSPELAPGYQWMHEALTRVAERLNCFLLLEPLPLASVPTLMGTRLIVERPFGLRPGIEVPNLLSAAGWLVLLLVAAMGLGALYLGAVGRWVQDETEARVPGPQPFFRIWLRLLDLLLLVLVAGVALGGPLLLIVSLLLLGLGALSQFLAAVLLTFLMSALLMGVVHLVYVVPGMVQMRRPPVKALWESFVMTRVDYPGTMFFAIAAFVLTFGLNIVWTLPGPESWTALVGVVGHAVVSTALVAALFIFYQERLAYLKVLQTEFKTQMAQSPVDGTS